MNGLSFSGWLGSGTDFSWQRGRAVLQILTAGYPVMATGDILCPPKQDSGKRRVVLKHCRAGLEVSGAPQKKRQTKAVPVLKTLQTKCKTMLQAKINAQAYF